MTREMVESFLTIVRLQTISAAAEELYISQSTLSHRLQVLEEELQARLFERQRGFKQMILTESGKQFVALASQWLELDQRIHNTMSQPSLGRVVIASMDSINQFLLSDMILKIKQEHPDIHLEFVSYHSHEIYSRLISHQVDIGFAFFPLHFDLTARPVFEEPMYMICSKESSYALGAIHPSMLKKSDEIYFTWSTQTESWNNEWWNENEKPFVKVDSVALMRAFLKNPSSWAICPASVATYLSSRGLVDVHPFVPAPPNRICYMLRRKQLHPQYSAAVDAFEEVFFNLLASHPYKYSQ